MNRNHVRIDKGDEIEQTQKWMAETDLLDEPEGMVVISWEWYALLVKTQQLLQLCQE